MDNTQDMDVDEDIYDFLPSVLRKYIIYYCRIYTSAKKFTDFLITGGQDPVLYEVSGKNILSSLHLNETIFRGMLPWHIGTYCACHIGTYFPLT